MTTAALALLLLGPAVAPAQEPLRMTTARQVGTEETVEMEIRYGAGSLTVGAAESGLLYQASLRYDGREFSPVRSYRLSDGTARVRLGVETIDGGSFDFDWDELSDIDLDRLESDAYEGRLEVGLSREVPTELAVDVGATESTFRLGGVPLRSFRLNTGASETEIDIDRPNPVPMEALEIQLGAASLEARGLGNAGAESIVVKGAVGDLTLDFTGSWSRDAEARVKVGLGSLTLRIPSDLGVKLEKSGVLSSFSGLGLEKAPDGSYRTPNWQRAEHHLVLDVETAFGSVDVEVVD